MTEFFPSSSFQAMVEARYDYLRSDACMNGDKGVVTNIAKGAAAVKAEFSRLEAIYKVPGERADELLIPHVEKLKLFELAADVAAMCMILSERTVPSRSRQTRLGDLPENCIIIRDEGMQILVTGERLKLMQEIYAANKTRIMAIPEEGKSVADVVEEHKEEIETALNKDLGGDTKVTIETSKAKKGKKPKGGDE